jgi:hypothetical protein
MNLYNARGEANVNRVAHTVRECAFHASRGKFRLTGFDYERGFHSIGEYTANFKTKSIVDVMHTKSGSFGITAIPQNRFSRMSPEEFMSFRHLIIVTSLSVSSEDPKPIYEELSYILGLDGSWMGAVRCFILTDSRYGPQTCQNE